MEDHNDHYTTIETPSPEVLFKDRKSKFFGRAFPITNESEIKQILESLKKEYPTAGHFCYAWQIGTENQTYRANDDGEPKNSAGMPIYGQIQSSGHTNLLIVVARIYGGTKLGVGGLINAYKTTAKMALEESAIVERVVEDYLKLQFDYPTLNEVMRVINKNKVRITDRKMQEKCEMVIAFPKGQKNKIEMDLAKLHKLHIIPLTQV